MNRGIQAATPRQLDTRRNDQLVGHGQGTPGPIPQPPLPLTAIPIKMDTDNGTTRQAYIMYCTYMCTKVYSSLSDWFSLVRPLPEGLDVHLRRESLVTLGIKLNGLSAIPGQPSVKWKSLVIPSTSSVRTEEYPGEGNVLHLSVRVFGADTKREYKAVCDACREREGKRRGKLSLVDFHAASNVIKAPEDGPVRVIIRFTCYPTHQSLNESAYL